MHDEIYLGMPLQTWLWVSGPLCLYCAERLYRYIRSCDPVTILAVLRHPCDVVELRMLKKNFRARPGQVIVWLVQLFLARTATL